MTKVAIDPAEDGYSVAFPAQAHVDQVEGGASRYRRDVLGARAKVTLQWFAASDGYDYLMAFYRSAAGYGVAPFTIDLIVDSGAPVEYTARFIPGTFQLSQIVGETFIVAAQLEVATPAPDSVTDASTIEVYELYGDDSGELLDELADFVNVWMPARIG